jgi:hypothetical protein
MVRDQTPDDPEDEASIARIKEIPGGLGVTLLKLGMPRLHGNSGPRTCSRLYHTSRT